MIRNVPAAAATSIQPRSMRPLHPDPNQREESRNGAQTAMASQYCADAKGSPATAFASSPTVSPRTKALIATAAGALSSVSSPSSVLTLMRRGPQAMADRRTALEGKSTCAGLVGRPATAAGDSCAHSLDHLSP